jgi:hypothetical protein
MSTDKNPKRDVAQAMPRAEYTIQLVSKQSLTRTINHSLCTVNSGKTAPSVYLKMPFAAIAEAPLSGPYTSVIYSAALV